MTVGTGKLRARLTVVPAALLLAACAGASMRIAVDVYKGPLANTEAIQKGQLTALLDAADEATADLESQLIASMCRIGCVQRKQNSIARCQNAESDCSATDAALNFTPHAKQCQEMGIPQRRALKFTAWWNSYRPEDYASREDKKCLADQVKDKDKAACSDPPPSAPLDKIRRAPNRRGKLAAAYRFPETEGRTYQVCPVYVRLRTQANTMKDQITKAQAKSDLANDHATVAGLAGAFRVLATAISFQLASVVPADKRLRIDMIKVANLGAEFANQFTARANALSAQADGIKRQVLPTGQYLRDTQPTAFIDLYDWLDASVDGGGLAPDQRVAVVKHLFDDDNWARINEAYASGVGEVSMAFIKDEIGNWNLKSFENDPTELVQAYTKFASDAVTKAASLVATGGAGQIAGRLGTAQSTLEAAQQSQIGDSGAGGKGADVLAGIDLKAVRAELQKGLTAIPERLNAAEEKAKEKDTEADEKKAEADRLRADPSQADRVAALENEERAAREAAAEIRKDAKEMAAEDVERIVEQYAFLIEALQQVVTAQAAQAAAED